MNRKTARNGSGPWSDATQPSDRPKASLGPAEIIALVGLLLLAAFGAASLYLNRYEIGSAGGVPARLDRLTGQVIGCVPGQGCLELIPAGDRGCAPCSRGRTRQRAMRQPLRLRRRRPARTKKLRRGARRRSPRSLPTRDRPTPAFGPVTN
jgi:hypothetical protein